MMGYGHWVDGSWLEGHSGERFERYDPANGELVGEFSLGDEIDVNRAVTAARTAFFDGRWCKQAPSKRARVLNNVADGIENAVVDLAAKITKECGKPIWQAEDEVRLVAEMFRFAAAITRTQAGSVYDLGPDVLGLILPEPMGVVGMIVPWNFPLGTLGQKLPFALAAGCSAVIKPSELTSLSIFPLVSILESTGVPTGVVNVVTGAGATGTALVQHPQVDKISFTGSTTTGRSVVRNGADTFKRVTVELGGKCANIVFADADIDAAVEAATVAVFFNQGEVCTSGCRLLVEEKIHDEFVEKLVRYTKTLQVGSPLNPDVHLGALISKEHLEKVESYVKLGQEEGAMMVCGGQRLTEGSLENGLFYPPTVFTRVNSKMRIAQEEIFGPVLSVIPFRTPDEAFEIANSTMYGLAHAVWTKNLNLAMKAVKNLRAGTVWVNTYGQDFAELPAGGFGGSGFGREMGVQGLLEFCETKSVQLFLNGEGVVRFP